MPSSKAIVYAESGPCYCNLGPIERAIGMTDLARITLEPGKRGGRPCVRGLLISVHDVLGWLASGMSETDILRDHPDLERENIRACLHFAADRERRMATGVA